MWNGDSHTKINEQALRPEACQNCLHKFSEFRSEAIPEIVSFFIQNSICRSTQYFSPSNLVNHGISTNNFLVMLFYGFLIQQHLNNENRNKFICPNTEKCEFIFTRQSTFIHESTLMRESSFIRKFTATCGSTFLYQYFYFRIHLLRFKPPLQIYVTISALQMIIINL